MSPIEQDLADLAAWLEKRKAEVSPLAWANLMPLWQQRHRAIFAKHFPSKPAGGANSNE